ncbi:unnamed protein product [Moneuplotes crassus]|uniref:RING-type domain-containing protein n=1 Tax=Euplotes crassus TaxID=5936 RepID=A0AAD1XS57_EUPCR|nr:unnamed protein product [Moneuplotes crassus]
MEGLRQPLLDPSVRNYEQNNLININNGNGQRESLVTEASYKLNANIIGAVVGLIVCIFYWHMQTCDRQVVIWFLLFTIFSCFYCAYLASFIKTQKISNLAYSIATYPLDLVTIGLFIYGFIIFSDLTEECSLSHPFPYYMMLIILIIQLSTFLKYISCGILVLMCIPVVAFILIREYQNRPEPEQTWEDFEENVFNNLEHKTLDSEIQKDYESCCICLVDFEKEDRIIVLKCSESHHFHRECIREWMLRQRTCPLCKQAVVE